MPEIKTTKKMPITAVDPHHDGNVTWGWDGLNLWVRHTGQLEWTRVSRIHPTRHRCRTLADLMSFSVTELKALRNAKAPSS